MSLINMYPEEDNPKLTIALVVSMTAFFLITIVQSIEMNSFIKGLGVLEIERLKKSSFVFAYLSGYYYMFFKIIMSLFVTYALVNVIGWTIFGITHMLKGGDQGGGAISNSFSAAHLMAGGGAELGEKMKILATKTATYFFGIIFLKSSLLYFLFITPMVLIVFVIMFAGYLKKDIIEERHEDQKERIATTNHNFVVYIITTMYVAIILFLCIPYLLRPPKAAA